jgi:hypothetical protein
VANVRLAFTSTSIGSRSLDQAMNESMIGDYDDGDIKEVFVFEILDLY